MQADLAEFIPYASQNKGHKYILVVINCYSKYLWARPLKTKNRKEVASALRNIFEKANDGMVPDNFQTDQGREFYNNHVTELMEEHNINHYSTYSILKASIAERIIRSLKGNLYQMFHLQGTHRWFDALQDVVDEYNRIKHRTI
ncbi:hypothetical protein ILUMI_16748, partial [Ignelater luminosus]